MRGNNPFNKWKLGFRSLDAAPSNAGGGNMTPANHKVVGPQELWKGSLRKSQGEFVNLPRNLYAPQSSISLEIRNSATIAAGAGPTLVLTYTVPPDAMAQIVGYALTTDGAGFTQFYPLVNGHRVFTQHGHPSTGYSITDSTGPDLGANGLIDAQLPLKAGDTLTWLVSNTDVAAHDVAIRTSGFVMSNQAYEDIKFGG